MNINQRCDDITTRQLLSGMPVDSIYHLFKLSNLKESPRYTGGTDDLASLSSISCFPIKYMYFYRLILIINCKYFLNFTDQPFLQIFLNFVFATYRFFAKYTFVL